MRIVIAMDSFKGTVTAAEACAAVGRGLRRRFPGSEIAVQALADGGEGTAEVLRVARGGETRSARVTGPLPDQTVDARWALLDDGTAVIDVAAASGLERVPPGGCDPLRATTFGTGELIAAAAAAGAGKLCIGAGGSATVDGGTGAAAALGWRFLDRTGRPLALGGGTLADLGQIEPPQAPLALPPLDVLCDVRNPLCGPHGAARTFAPQKGADRATVERLEAGLERLAELLGDGSGAQAFGGAAGGLAIGLRSLLGAPLLPGAATIADALGFDGGTGGTLAGADWVVTGEGRLDATSLNGKVVSEVVARARTAGVRVAAISGRCELATEELANLGIARSVHLVDATAPDLLGADTRQRLALAAEHLRLS